MLFNFLFMFRYEKPWKFMALSIAKPSLLAYIAFISAVDVTICGTQH